MKATKLAAVCVIAGALTLATGMNADAANNGGCANVTVGRAFGEICTFASRSNPVVGWYGGEGSPATTVRIGLTVSKAGKVLRTAWTGPQEQPADGGVVVRDWVDEPFRAGHCYTGLVQIDGQVSAAPAICK
jgi:hypothetical protein